MRLFDSHCHLQLPQFELDREEVLARMQAGEVGGVVVGTDLTTSREALELAKQHDFLWAAVGLHPNDNVNEVFYIDAYEALARDPKVVAIGECGLDYFRSGGTDEERATQKVRFETQIELAQKVNKALIVHCRNAHDDCVSVLQKTAITSHVPVIIHFCTVTGEIAQKYLELGCYLSFPGPITYTDMYDESIRLCPLNRILVETDAPFAAPVPHRGKRNEPLFVGEVMKKAASLKEISEEEAAVTIVQNAQKAFGLPFLH